MKFSELPTSWVEEKKFTPKQLLDFLVNRGYISIPNYLKACEMESWEERKKFLKTVYEKT